MKFARKGLYLALLVGVLASGCRSTSFINFTPERAALQAVVDNPLHSMQIDEESIRILQSQPFEDRVFVLAAFTGRWDGGQRDLCDYLYEARRSRFGGWTAGGGGGLCGPVDDQSPLSVGGGQSISIGPGGMTYSNVRGLVRNSEIVKVEVTWDDGEIQRAAVVNASFLAIRAGLHEYGEVRGLSADGTAVHSVGVPVPAPGKVGP